MRPAGWAPLSVLGLGLWWALGAAPALDGAQVPRFGLLYFSAVLIVLLGYAFALEVKDAPPALGERAEPPRIRRALWVLLIGALAFRACMLAASPSLSQDVERYVWEGRVQLSGHNPYVVAPADPQLSELRDEGWTRVNHRQVPGIYGPAMELAFAALALLGGLSVFKLAFVLADLCLAFLVLRSLARARASPLWLVLYLWHPLPILEVAGQGHLEVVPVLGLVLAVDLELRGRRRLAALCLGAAIAAKYLPLLVVPAFLLNVRGWKARARRLALIALPSALLLAPYLLAGGGPGSGLSTYGRSWRFNDGGFFLIDAVMQASGASQAFCRTILPRFIDVPSGWDPAAHRSWILYPAKLVTGVVVAAVVAWVSRPKDERVDVERAAFTAGALFLVFSPTVHPWYALWVLPFLPARLARGIPGTSAWLVLTLVLPVAYAATAGGTWHDEGWTRPLIYLPVLALLVAGWVRKSRPGQADSGLQCAA